MSRLLYSCLAAILLILPLSSYAIDVYGTSIPGLEADLAGVYVENLATGEVLLDVNGEIPMLPASVTKLVTSATALSALGPDWTFSTPVYAEGKIHDGVLKGNIVIMASGDPTVESPNFKEYNGLPDSIAAACAALGISAIDGSVIVDHGSYIETPVPDGWTDDDIVWPYGAGLFAMNFKGNRVALTMPGAGISPETPGAKVKTNGPRKGDRFSRARGSKVINTYLPRRFKGATALSNPDPESSFVKAVSNALTDAGITVGASPAKRHKKHRTLLVDHQSPPLADILTSLMMRSDNLMAEGVLRALAPEKSIDEALEAELKFWQNNGVDTCSLRINDGSGLSRLNRISPYALADVLVWMLDHSDNFLTYLDMFPVAGVSGTFRSFGRDTSLEGRLRCKTGSVNGTQTYAGYVVNDAGIPTHVVVVMVNGFKGSRAAVRQTVRDLLLEVIG